MTKAEKAYIAGFFDGEGCVSMTNAHPRLIFSQRDPTVLKWIQEKLGYGNLGVNHRQGLDDGDCWKLSIHRTALVHQFCCDIGPYCHVKRKKLRQAKRRIEQDYHHLIRG